MMRQLNVQPQFNKTLQREGEQQQPTDSTLQSQYSIFKESPKSMDESPINQVKTSTEFSASQY